MCPIITIQAYHASHSYIKEMNVVVRQLNKKKNAQQFIAALLDDVQTYFKGAPAMSSEKIQATINTIFTRIQRDFPLLAQVPHINKRILRDLHDKITDRCQKIQLKKKSPGLRSFMENIQTQQPEIAKSSSQQGIQTLNVWLKKVLLEGIREVKQDIAQAEEGAKNMLAIKLKRVSSPNQSKPVIVFLDSFLSNDKIVGQLKDYDIRRVVFKQGQLAPTQLRVQDSPQHLRGANLLLISADAVLRNGGILSKNGALLLAIVAKQLNIPVLAVTRSYCLWQHILVNQQPLVQTQNNMTAFQGEDESAFRVLIGKQYDYVQGRLINSIVGETNWQKKSIVQLFEEYLPARG